MSREIHNCPAGWVPAYLYKGVRGDHVGAARSPAATARHRSLGDCMRHRSIDEWQKYAEPDGQSRFVSPNAFAYGSDGYHPRWDKIEHLLRQCRHQIFFGTFPSEVRPEFVCGESLDLISGHCANTKLHFGAQSGSDTVLRHLHRGLGRGCDHCGRTLPRPCDHPYRGLHCRAPVRD